MATAAIKNKNNERENTFICTQSYMCVCMVTLPYCTVCTAVNME